MIKEKGSKKLKIYILSTVFIIIVIGIFLSMVFSNSSYTEPITKISSELVDKIRQASKQGATIELDSKELNAITNMYFKNEKSFGEIKVKGVYDDILNNHIKLYIPVNYKGFNLLLSTEGKLYYENNKIKYSPINIKVGKISLPKSIVLDKLQKHLKKNILFDNGNIAIDKSILPIEIKSLEVKDNKIFIGIEKSSLPLEDKIKSLNGILNNSTSGKGSSDPEVNNSNNTINSSTNNKGDNHSSSNAEKIVMDSKNSAEREDALNRINSGLNSAMASVSTGAQRAVIGQVISVVNSMKGNPSYNPYSTSGSVKAAYKSLSSKEKEELKSAVLSNVDPDAINIVIKLIGAK